jgi:hypothetical protein
LVGNLLLNFPILIFVLSNLLTPMKNNITTPIALAVRELLHLPRVVDKVLSRGNDKEATFYKTHSILSYANGEQVLVNYKPDGFLIVVDKNEDILFAITKENNGNFTTDNRISGLEGTELIRLLEGAIYCEIF